jgi:hypothetical protein
VASTCERHVLETQVDSNIIRVEFAPGRKEDLTMAQDTKVAENTCLIPTFERNRYFSGKPLMVGDFKAEQQYMIGKNRLQNRLIHGAGIICGLKLSNERIVDDKLSVDISEGAALDCCGNLIVVNQLTPVEVRAASSLAGGAVTDGDYYLYIRFSECERQPIKATTNASSCEEVCCYNRIRETFELVLSTRAPVEVGFSFEGAVKTGGGDARRGIAGARVRALQQGVVKAQTLSRDDGSFSLGIGFGGGVFDIDASATGFSGAQITQSIPAGQRQVTLDEFVLTPTAGPAPAEVCNELVRKYFEGHSLTCEGCEDPKVFLGVVKINGPSASIDRASPEARAVVYTNPMLHDLYCDHVSDFNNPHRTTAEQTRALQSMNNVGNVSGGPYVSNVDLDSDDETIEVTPDSDDRQIHLQLAANAVKPNHLNDDTINTLLISDGTIVIQPDAAAKNILIKTNPATSVTSVGTAKVIGTSKDLAPTDHAHDLANGVVTKPKLGEDVITTLLASDGTITITPNVGTKQISIKTNKATQVTSVGKEKKVGTSNNFSPEDHQHNIQINDRVPDAKGTFRLTAGKNVEISAGAENELVFSAKTSQSQSSNVTTGLVRFEGVIAGRARQSPDIKHGLKSNTVAIVLGLDLGEMALIGDLAVDPKQSPPLILGMSPRNDSETFRITIRDTRKEGAPLTITVRWWAIPFTAEMETVVSPAEGPVPQ